MKPEEPFRLRLISIRLRELVVAQLPRDLRNRLAVVVQGDTYLLHAVATFARKDTGERVCECPLEQMLAGDTGANVAAKIPDTVLAMLAVRV